MLCGGRSTRFGPPKALFPYDGVPMLRRVVDAVDEVCLPRFVVAARGQELPELPTDVVTVYDHEADVGPLHALAVGLTACAKACEFAFLASCDVPLLHADFVRTLFALVGNEDALVPTLHGQVHPLVAVYRTSCGAKAWQTLQGGTRSLHGFLAMIDAKYVDVESLPERQSLTNINSMCDLPSVG